MMPINPAEVPAGVTRSALVESQLVRRAQRAVGTLDSNFEMAGEPSSRVEASPPLPVYSIPLDVLGQSEAEALASARQHGWRVLTRDRHGTQLVDVELETQRAVAVRRGPSVAILAQAGTVAEAHASRDVSYEPRILDFGRLGMSALWLHSEQGPDRFFTLESEPRELSETQLLAEAGARARARAGVRDRGGGRDEETDLPPDLGG